MTYDGKVEEIVYVNEETGYTVLYFSADEEYFTAVGIFPLIAEGELLRITGEFKVNKKFGEQFVVDRVEFSKPNDLMGICKFLASGLFKGIGEKMAMQIVNYFGIDTLKILDETPERLCEVRGIGHKKCIEIITAYNASRKMKESILFLQKYDIPMGLAIKIYRKYENATIPVVSDNPYQLVNDIEGVGFLTADKIASKMGIDKHSPFRIKAGIRHTLQEGAMQFGHTCLPVENLIVAAEKLLGVTEEEVRENLPDTPNVKQLSVDGVMTAADAVNYETENSISSKLIRLTKTVSAIGKATEGEVDEFQKAFGIQLDEKQRDAITSVFNGGVTVITGGPGTGKTTIIRGIATIMRQRGKKVMLSAPTGRACKRIFEATGEDAKTIHRLLGMDFGDHTVYNEMSPLPVDVLIVDEISMADIYIFNKLLKAIPTGSRLVLVGDKDQLPSVSCGNILADIIGCGFITTVYLTEVHRQTQDSYIVTNAHRINHGEIPVVKGASDFFFVRKNDSLDILKEVVGMTKTRIPNYLHIAPDDIQVLVPMKKGLVGAENINRELQNALNPSGFEKQYGENLFRVGDRVMQTVNNYEAVWKKEDGETGSGVFNGDLGYVYSIGKDGMTVLFEDGKKVLYEDGATDEIMLAYCISVHKSQGSEFPVVILVLGGSSPTLMTRNLLYTAVTRAKRMVVIIGGDEQLSRMVHNDYTVKRYSLLGYLLQKNKSKFELLWGNDDA